MKMRIDDMLACCGRIADDQNVWNLDGFSRLDEHPIFGEHGKT